MGRYGITTGTYDVFDALKINPIVKKITKIVFYYHKLLSDTVLSHFNYDKYIHVLLYLVWYGNFTCSFGPVMDSKITLKSPQIWLNCKHSKVLKIRLLYYFTSHPNERKCFNKEKSLLIRNKANQASLVTSFLLLLTNAFQTFAPKDRQSLL